MAYAAEVTAGIVHEAFRAIQAADGDDMPALPWMWVTRSARQLTIAGVLRVQAGMTAQQNHEHWCANMLASGWEHGDVKDPEKKTHPDIVPWDELPERARIRARVFVSLVRELSGKEEAA